MNKRKKRAFISIHYEGNPDLKGKKVFSVILNEVKDLELFYNIRFFAALSMTFFREIEWIASHEAC